MILYRDHRDGGSHRSHSHTGRQVSSEIRVFAEDEILTEITETEAITALNPIQDSRVTSEIRVFAEDEILTEITETEAVTALTPIQDGR
jgi:hypothetical protein